MRYESARRPALVFSLIVASLAAPTVARAATFQCAQCHALSADLREEVIRSFDRTVTISGTPTLRVEHRNGDVRVRSHARNDLRIQATIHVSATSRAEAEDFAARVQIDIQESIGSITVRTQYPASRRDLSYSVDYDLLVPERMPLDVRNNFGDVSVIGLKADGAVVNANGRLSVTDGSGRYRLENSFGPIEALHLAGDVTINGANGSVTGVNIDGSAIIKTSFGQVTLRRIRGSLTVDNANGGVQAAAIGGAASVTSSFGSVVLKDVDGRVDVRNSNGAVEVWPFVKPGTCHDIALMTSFSPMQVHVPDSGYTVAARTTSGTIRADVPITATGTISGNSISGTIGRGGCSLQLTNTNGNIQILRAVATR